MRILPRALALAAAALLLPACGTAVNLVTGPQVFGGVRHQSAKISNDVHDPYNLLRMIDIVPSLALDVALLPVTFTFELVRAATGWPPEGVPTRKSATADWNWTIVVAEYPGPDDGARELGRALDQAGWDAHVRRRDGVTDVHVNHYKTREEAEADLPKLRSFVAPDGRPLAPEVRPH